jgi:hypothetical protein
VHLTAAKQIRARFIRDEARAHEWSWTRGHDAAALSARRMLKPEGRAGYDNAGAD